MWHESLNDIDVTLAADKKRLSKCCDAYEKQGI
jgi:hypothetical protein